MNEKKTLQDGIHIVSGHIWGPQTPQRLIPYQSSGEGWGADDLFSAEPRVTAKESETTQDQWAEDSPAALI